MVEMLPGAHPFEELEAALNDGKTVLTGSADTSARLWHLDDQELIGIACAALSRDLTAEERATYGIAEDVPTCART